MPLTDAEVDKTFFDIEEAIRYRLRMSEIIPVEMADYCICERSWFFVGYGFTSEQLMARPISPSRIYSELHYVYVEMLNTIPGLWLMSNS